MSATVYQMFNTERVLIVYQQCYSVEINGIDFAISDIKSGRFRAPLTDRFIRYF